MPVFVHPPPALASQVTLLARTLLEPDGDQYHSIRQGRPRRCTSWVGDHDRKRVDDGICNPESVAFRWKHELHQAMFVIRYDGVDRVARGGVRVFADHVILAEVSLAIPVQERTSPGRQVSSVIESRPLTHRRVFASYSHKDKPVVRQLAAAARALGTSISLMARHFGRANSGRIGLTS